MNLVDWLRYSKRTRLKPEHYLHFAEKDREGFLDGLRELEKAGKIRLKFSRMKDARLLVDASSDRWLPDLITILEKTPLPKKPWEEAPLSRWHSGLRQIPRKTETLWKINLYLERHPLPAPVPARERALKVTGDEKAFDHLAPAVAKLLNLVYPNLVTGPVVFDCDGPCLIVENQHTTHSLIEWNRRTRRYSAITCGQGNSACKADFSWIGARPAEYFGDLDMEGIRIASRVHEITGCSPCRWAYSFLMSQPLRKIGKTGRPPLDFLDAWLPNLGIADMWKRGEWIPQEALGTEELDSFGSEMFQKS